MREAVYDVFARKRRAEPLRHIGYVDALDDALARVHAWKTYDEENWFEMCVVRRSHIIPVNRSDGPYAGRAVRGAGRRPVSEAALPERKARRPGATTAGRPEKGA